MSKILITGGQGFLGKRTAEILSEMGHEVTCFDIALINKTEGKNLPYKKTLGSILNSLDVDRAMKRCDIVVHFAAMVGVRITEKKSLDCLHINIQGTSNVLDAAVKNKVKKIIFSSSSEVYGEQEKFPIFEDANLTPKSNYGISKIVGEEYVKAYNKLYGIKFNICRFFNLYGPGQKEDFVIPKFAGHIKKNETIKVYGDGKQIRSYCYIDDAVKGIINILEKGKDNTTYNVGNDLEPISVIDLANKMVMVSKKKIKIEKVPFEQSDRGSNREIYRREPSVEKLRKETGYTPKVKLEAGIKEILAKI